MRLGTLSTARSIMVWLSIRRAGWSGGKVDWRARAIVSLPTPGKPFKRMMHDGGISGVDILLMGL